MSCQDPKGKYGETIDISIYKKSHFFLAQLNFICFYIYRYEVTIGRVRKDYIAKHPDHPGFQYTLVWDESKVHMGNQKETTTTRHKPIISFGVVLIVYSV